MSRPKPNRCGWTGALPAFREKSPCALCHKLRSAGDVARCQIRGGPRIEGLGDMIATVTHATGLAQVVETVAHVLGADCGCQQRQDALNKAFPIGSDDAPEGV